MLKELNKKYEVWELVEMTENSNDTTYSYLLSDYQPGETDIDFWKLYRENHHEFDLAFATRYGSFRYFREKYYTPSDDVSPLLLFQDDVKRILTINQKKYGEMYRLEQLNDEDYGLFDNVNLKKTENVQDASIVSNTEGARSDSNSISNGARIDTNENQVSAFNETTYQNANKDTTNIGAQTNSETFSKGAQINNGTSNRTAQNITTIVGKDGGDTLTKAVSDFDKYWNKYQGFYYYIFEDICRNLLLV